MPSLFADPLPCGRHTYKIRHGSTSDESTKVGFVNIKELFQKMNSLPFDLRRYRIGAAKGILIERAHQPIARNRSGCASTYYKTEVARTGGVGYPVGEMILEIFEDRFCSHA